MITSPSIDDMLEGLILALDADIMPHLEQPKAQASAQMMQSLLQGIRQLLPVYDASLIEEHNEMNKGIREAAALVEGVSGPEADRMRARAETIAAVADLPAPLDMVEVKAAHRVRTEAVRDSLIDLDELQRAGVDAADDSLNALRAMLTPHYLRYMGTFPMQGGMLGRG